jgi:hypothetical protein
MSYHLSSLLALAMCVALDHHRFLFSVFDFRLRKPHLSTLCSWIFQLHVPWGLQEVNSLIPLYCCRFLDRLCGLVVRVLGYRSGGPGSIPGTTRKKVVGLERGPLSLVSATEELLDRKVAAPV